MTWKQINLYMVVNLFWGWCYFTWRQKYIVSKVLSCVVLCVVIMEKDLINIIDKTCVNSCQKFIWFNEEICVTFLVEETKFLRYHFRIHPKTIHLLCGGRQYVLQNVRTFNCYAVYKLNRRPSFGRSVNLICSPL